MAKSKPHWYSIGVDEIEQRFRTNQHTGLSSEEAERRRIRNNSILCFPELSAKDAVKLVMSDVATYYIAIIAMLCLVFQRWLEAVVVLIIIAANSALTAFLKVVSNKYENAVMAPSVPRCDVLRDGRAVSVDARSVVEGDVILVKSGDILPCDARVVKAKDLLVYEQVEDEHGKKGFVTSKKVSDVQNRDYVERSGKKPNMIMAGSIVNGGYALCIAVACGKHTELVCGGDSIEMRQGNGISEFDDKIGKLFKYITIGLIAMLIPFIFVALFSKNASASPIDCIIQIGAVAASLPMQTVTVIYSTVMCCVVRYCSMAVSGSPTSSAAVKRYSSASRLCDVKKIFLLGRKSVTGIGICVESVFSAFKETVIPEQSENPNDVRLTLEHAFLINKASVQVTGVSDLFRDRAQLLGNELRSYDVDVKTLLSDYSVMSHKILGAEEAADVSIVSAGNDFKSRPFLICRALDRRIIDCAQWYSSNGVAVIINDHLRERLIETYNRYRALGYEVITIAKSTAQLYDKSSFDEFDDQLVLEGMIAIGNVYARTNAVSAYELTKMGISPVVCLDDEGSESYYAVRNVFRDITQNPTVVYASVIKENGESLLDYLDADAYLGFDAKQIQSLIDAQRNAGVKCAAVATDLRDLKTAGKTDYVVAYSYDTFNENACTTPYQTIANASNASCSVVKRQSDLLVYPVTRRGGGLDGILTAVKRTRPFLSNLRRVVSYLLFSLTARITAVYLPLLFGRQAMTPAMTLFLGCIVDLLAVIAIAHNPMATSTGGSDKDHFASVLSILKGNLKSMITAFLCGALIFAAGMMIPRGAVLEAQSYTFIALLIVQIIRTVFDLLGASKRLTANKLLYITATVILILLITALFGVIPGIRTVVGLAGGIAAYLRAFIITVITFALLFLDHKARKKE